MNIDDLNPFTTDTSYLSDSLGIGESSGSVSTIDIKKRKSQLLTKRYLTEKDAYVTGFFYATIESVPPAFISFMRTYYPTGNWNEDNIIEIFSSSITEVQLPAETLKTTQFNGRAGHTVTSPLFSQKGNTITIQFLADQNMQITSLLMGWYDYITKVNDGRYNIETMLNESGIIDLDSKTNIYGVNFYYGALLPDMSTITFAFAAEGLFPTTMPINDMGHTAGQTDALRHSVTFSIDYYDFWIKNKSETYWIKDMLDKRISGLREPMGGLFSGGSDFHYKFEDEPPSAEDKFSLYAYENKQEQDTKYAEDKSFSLAHQNTLDGNGPDKWLPNNQKSSMELTLD